MARGRVDRRRPARGANRVTFTEITRDAVQRGVPAPARDRLRPGRRPAGPARSSTGWWATSCRRSCGRRSAPGLSAGRVQSVALRLIVDREREIEAFVPGRVLERRRPPRARRRPEQPFLARLIQVGRREARGLARQEGPGPLDAGGGRRPRRAAARRGATASRRSDRRSVKRTPAPPFTTSTLQQEAARKLGFSAPQDDAARPAPVRGRRPARRGHRSASSPTCGPTRSTSPTRRCAELADVVKGQYGEEYALAEPRRYKKKQRGAQEAHEAIRPTSAARYAGRAEPYLDRDQARLYRLIWQRTWPRRWPRRASTRSRWTSRRRRPARRAPTYVAARHRARR